MPQPLEGIRVLEWGMFHAGPGGVAILGDLGAEVIKIEQPGVGDLVRYQKHFGHASFELPGGKCLFFEAANRNKKGITIDLSKDKGKEIAYRLVSKSDVFLTSLRKKTVEKMGMTYPILSRFNPKLIYASVSAYGLNGPDRNLGGFDFQGQARSGMMFAMGEPDMPPLVLHFGVIDQATAIMASHQIITALLMRERFGTGQEVHISILGSTLFLLYLNVLTALFLGREVPRHERLNTNPLRNYYLCGDRKWLSLGIGIREEHYWPLLCQALGRPELANDPKFDTAEKRLDNSPELIPIFDRIFGTKPRAQWLKAFAECDIISCPVNSPLELADDPQIMENHYIVDFEHPTMGKIKIPGYPGWFSQSWAKTRSIAPELGEHTEEVLKEVGGYSEEEIAQFRKEGII